MQDLQKDIDTIDEPGGPDELPDFPSRCGFFPCRCGTDLAAVYGKDEENCREIEELRRERDEARAEIARLRGWWHP